MEVQHLCDVHLVWVLAALRGHGEHCGAHFSLRSFGTRSTISEDTGITFCLDCLHAGREIADGDVGVQVQFKAVGSHTVANEMGHDFWGGCWGILGSAWVAMSQAQQQQEKDVHGTVCPGFGAEEPGEHVAEKPCRKSKD